MKMRRITAILLPILLSFTAYAAEFTLSGKNLTTEQVTRIARDNSIKVTYGESASKAVSDSFDLVMEAALQGRPVYGLTVGVGWNKDQPVFAEKDGKRVLNEDLVALSKAFNLTSLRAHGGGIGAPMPKDVVRASMVIRLNQILTGRTGVQPEVAQMYLAFLNSGIVPVVPSRGSVGEADITQLSHIGLAMVGEGDVFYQGTEMPAKEALDKAGLAPLDIIGKDFLSILSNNSLTAAHSTLMAEDVESYLHKQAVVFALMLEGYNGNVAPFLKGTAAIRPFPGFQKGAALLNDALDGSYLWQPSNQRALQDPLSFRNAAYTIGNALESQNQLEAMLEIHINHSDDNPVVVVDAPRDGISEQEKNYFIEGDVSGAIFPTANFEILPVGARVEGLNRALVRLSQSITMQTIRLENPALTKLSRFLSAEGNNGHAFGAMQKPIVALHVENAQIGLNAPIDTMAMAGNIEDIATNAPLAVANLETILDNLYWMSSIQMLHAAQAVDLRGDITLASKTKRLFDAYRGEVPFVDQDRIYSNDFAAGYRFLQSLSTGQAQ